MTPSPNRIARIRAAAILGVHDVTSLLISMLAVAPMGLIGGHAAERYVGILYAVIYVLVILPSCGVYSFLILDSILIACQRPPAAFPNLFSANGVSLGLKESEIPKERLGRVIGLLAQLSVYANPLSAIARWSFRLAIELQTAYVRQLIALAKQAREGQPIGTIQNPQAQLAEPIVQEETTRVTSRTPAFA